MTALDRVNQLKSGGRSENEIIQTLQSEGVSPREITEALSQSQIKQAVSNMAENNENMQPSMMGGKLSEFEKPVADEYIPKPQGGTVPSPQGIPTPSPQTPPSPGQQQYEEYIPQGNPQQTSSTEYIPQTPYDQTPQANDPYTYAQEPSTGGEEFYPQEQQQVYEDYSYQGASTDTSIEIAEQVFAEKMKKSKDQISDLIEFKTLFESKMENIETRLNRIEKMFDQMQISIIEKVGAYGKGLQTLKKEVEMVEDSFSKIVNKATKTHSKK